MLAELIKYVEDPSSARFAPQYYGYILSGVLFVSSALQSLSLHQVLAPARPA